MLTTLLLLLAAAMSVAGAATYQETVDRVEGLTKQIAGLTERIDAMTTKRNRQVLEAGGVTDRTKDLSARIAEMQSERDSAQTILEIMQEKLAKLQAAEAAEQADFTHEDPADPSRYSGQAKRLAELNAQIAQREQQVLEMHQQIHDLKAQQGAIRDAMADRFLRGLDLSPLSAKPPTGANDDEAHAFAKDLAEANEALRQIGLAYRRGTPRDFTGPLRHALKAWPMYCQVRGVDPNDFPPPLQASVDNR